MSPAQVELGITARECRWYPLIDVLSTMSHPVLTVREAVATIRERNAR